MFDNETKINSPNHKNHTFMIQPTKKTKKTIICESIEHIRELLQRLDDCLKVGIFTASANQRVVVDFSQTLNVLEAGQGTVGAW